MHACTRIGGPDEGGSDLFGSSEGRSCWFGWKHGVLCPHEALISSPGKWWRSLHPSSDVLGHRCETETQRNTFNQCTRSEHLQGHKLPSPAASALEINDAWQVSSSIHRVQCIWFGYCMTAILHRVPRDHGTHLWASDRVSYAWFLRYIICNIWLL